MIHDLEHLAGFPLWFDTARMDVSTGPGLSFKREPRRCRQMAQVLRQPLALPPETEIYWTFNLQPSGETGSLFERLAMTFGLVLLPPLLIGDEFVKTHGHYHSAMPDASTGYSEVYTHYYGKLYLYMQRRAKADSDRLDDCILYEMAPGCSVQIPPGYAHILINPSDQPALMAGLYSRRADHIYEPIQQLGGGAYHLVRQDGKECILPNSRYAHCPELKRISQTDGTHFAAPNGCRPLWSSFMEDPARFSFIYDSSSASSYFLLEDQRL